MQELLKWYKDPNGLYFPSEVDDKINELIAKEKQIMIDFHIGVMKDGLIHEGERKWKDAYEPKIREMAEKHYSQNYEGVAV